MAASNIYTVAATERTALDVGNMVHWGGPGSGLGWRRSEKQVWLQPGDNIATAITDVGANGTIFLTTDSASNTYTISTGLSVAASGIQIIGLGKPIIQRTANVVSLTLSNNYAKVSNVTFTSDANYASALVSVTGDNNKVENCYFEGYDVSPSAGEAGVSLGAASDLCEVIGCYFINLDPCVNVVSGAKTWKIINNEMLGTAQTSGSNLITVSGAGWRTDGLIANNYLKLWTAVPNPLIYVGPTSGDITNICITNNILDHMGSSPTVGEDGIELYGTSGSSGVTESVVSNNVMNGCDRGILATYCRKVSLVGNSFSATTDGIRTVTAGTACIAMGNVHNAASYIWVAGWTYQTAAGDAYNV